MKKAWTIIEEILRFLKQKASGYKIQGESRETDVFKEDKTLRIF